MHVLIHTSVAKKLQKLNKKDRERIKLALNLLKNFGFKRIDVKKLRGKENIFRLRVGKYRILFKLEKQTIIVFKIDKRESVYD